MKSKIYLFILISLGFAPLKAQKKFSGGAGVSLLASQIDGDQAAGYSKFGGSIEVFTRFSLENTVCNCAWDWAKEAAEET